MLFDHVHPKTIFISPEFAIVVVLERMIFLVLPLLRMQLPPCLVHTSKYVRTVKISYRPPVAVLSVARSLRLCRQLLSAAFVAVRVARASLAW